mmetsp:Transcript_7863/g.20979  ORF Transcript_7863/g.20979 Transcript_7863/m.20979 type:complete len:226 (-) Transcript_7863:779-1456(-)
MYLIIMQSANNSTLTLVSKGPPHSKLQTTALGPHSFPLLLSPFFLAPAPRPLPAALALVSTTASPAAAHRRRLQHFTWQCQIYDHWPADLAPSCTIACIHLFKGGCRSEPLLQEPPEHNRAQLNPHVLWLPCLQTRRPRCLAAISCRTRCRQMLWDPGSCLEELLDLCINLCTFCCTACGVGPGGYQPQHIHGKVAQEVCIFVFFPVHMLDAVLLECCQQPLRLS